MEQFYQILEIYKKITAVKDKSYDGKGFLNWRVFSNMKYNQYNFLQAVENTISEQEDDLLELNEKLQELRRLYSLEKNPVYIEIGNEYKKLIEIEKKRLVNFEPINYYK